MAKRYKYPGESKKKDRTQQISRTGYGKKGQKKLEPSAKIDKRKYKKSKKPTTEVQIEDEEVIEEEKEERFGRAFIISLALIALLSLLILIPFLGPLLTLTLVPYLACNIGCKYVTRKNGVQVGLLVGILWSIIEFNLLIVFLDQIKIAVGSPAIRSALDMFIIVLIFIANIVFCVLGGYTGGAKFEHKEPEEEIEDLTKTTKSKKRKDKIVIDNRNV